MTAAHDSTPPKCERRPPKEDVVKAGYVAGIERILKGDRLGAGLCRDLSEGAIGPGLRGAGRVSDARRRFTLLVSSLAGLSFPSRS